MRISTWSKFSLLANALLFCSAVFADPAATLLKLKALPSFADAGYVVCPHVTSHQTQDALKESNIPLLAELQRILDVPTDGIRSSAVCLRYDTYKPEQLVVAQKLLLVLGDKFCLGVGGRPWGSTWGPNGKEPPEGAWTGPLHAGWAAHLEWTRKRLVPIATKVPISYATWDEEELAQQAVPVALWDVVTLAQIQTWRGATMLPQTAFIPYKANSYMGIVPIEHFAWRTGQAYDLNDPAYARSEMKRLAAEGSANLALWVSLNRFTVRNADGSSGGFNGVVTPAMAYAFGSEIFGAGCDTHAPFSRLRLIVWYECAGVDETWWQNFLAYARGVLGMPLE